VLFERGKDSPEIETEGIYGELLSQLLLVNIIFMADRKSKHVPRIEDEESEVPRCAMEDLEGEGTLSSTCAISEELD